MARHVYGFNLDASKIAALMEDLPRTIALAGQDLLAFADFLQGTETRRDDTGKR